MQARRVVSFPKREAQAFPLAPSAGSFNNPAPSQPPGIPQAEAIENLLYRVQVTAGRVKNRRRGTGSM